ncbi:MAG TPA: hypothetical protein GXX49_02650 [Clostridiaceae bacterium]|nr:hypothetical protein [Clostridiaceae bacterium]
MRIDQDVLRDCLANFTNILSLENILCLVLFFIGFGIVLRQFSGKLAYKFRKYKLAFGKSRKTRLTRFTNRLLKVPFLDKALKSIAIRVSMFTDYSYSKNLEIAVVVFLITIIVVCICFAVQIAGLQAPWYVFLAYLCFALFFACLSLYLVNVYARLKFTGKLPETYKLINSRYISHGNILKAISKSIELDDFDRVVKKVMRTIRDVLIRNDMQEIDKTFLMIEQNYKNEFLTLLLNLIRQAHYKGGEKVIKQQFENATEEILLDIENQKDLSSTARMYILLAIIMPFCILGIEKFNLVSLSEKAANFYQSPSGHGLKLCIMFSLVLYIGCMLLLERSV